MNDVIRKREVTIHDRPGDKAEDNPFKNDVYNLTDVELNELFAPGIVKMLKEPIIDEDFKKEVKLFGEVVKKHLTKRKKGVKHGN